MSEGGAVRLLAKRGRRPSPKPKSAHVGVRLDVDRADAIDDEVRRLEKAHPGIPFTRSMVIRALITEHLVKRRAK